MSQTVPKFETKRLTFQIKTNQKGVLWFLGIIKHETGDEREDWVVNGVEEETQRLVSLQVIKFGFAVGNGCFGGRRKRRLGGGC